MGTVINCFLDCDVMNFKINLFFLIEPFYKTRKSRQKFEYLENEYLEFLRLNKTIFIMFKGLSVPKSCLRPEIAPILAFNKIVNIQRNTVYFKFSWHRSPNIFVININILYSERALNRYFWKHPSRQLHVQS